MNQRTKIILCIIGNFFILCLVSLFSIMFAGEESKYWKFGPNKDLHIISLKIDTWTKYFLLLIGIMLINSSKVLVEEIGMPVLGFSIYNPDKKKIDEFGKIELQIYGQLMFFFSSLRGVLSILIIISQIDISIFSVIIDNLTTTITIRILLNEKQFITKSINTKEQELLMSDYDNE